VTKGKAAAREGRGLLPCLFVTIAMVAGRVKRMGEAVTQEVRALVREYGLERIAFVTLTFPETIASLVEAQSRWHSLRTGVLAKRYPRAICAVERHKSGGIHWHLILVLPEAMGCVKSFAWADWDKYKKAAAVGGGGSLLARFHTHRYRSSACPVLRAEWAFWREVAPRYGFGRVNTLPVRVSGDAVSRYLAKYVTKAAVERSHEDRRARLVRFVGYLRTVEWFAPVEGEVVRRRISMRRHTAQFGWATVGGHCWRAKAAAYCRKLGRGDVQLGHLRCRLIAGARWAFALRQYIVNQPLPLGLPPPVLARAALWEHSQKVQTCHLAPVVPPSDLQRHYVPRIKPEPAWVSPILDCPGDAPWVRLWP